MISPRPSLLLVDSEPSTLSLLTGALGSRFNVQHVPDAARALAECDRLTLDMAVVSFAGDAQAATLVTRLRETQPLCCVVALTGAGDTQGALTALQDGAQEFLFKPLPGTAETVARLEAALARKQRSAEGQLLLSPYSAARTALIKNFDVRYLRGLMQSTRGNISEASRRSGIDRANLRRMLRHHEISPLDFGAVRPPPRA